MMEALYTTGEALGVTGGGSGASINIDDIGRGGITQIFIDSVVEVMRLVMILYLLIQIQVVVLVNKVSLVNGGIVAEEGTSDMTEGTDHIVLEDETQRGDAYTGNKIVQDLVQVLEI